MCCVQSPRLATVEALCQVVRIPKVEVANLRALDADNAEEVSRRNLECLGVPRQDRELHNFGKLSACRVVKRRVERWQFLDRIRQHRRCPAPRRRVGGWRRMCGLRHAFNSSETRQYATRIPVTGPLVGLFETFVISEKARASPVIQEAWIGSVSTRGVDDLVQAM